jgi:hypothetical protein
MTIKIDSLTLRILRPLLIGYMNCVIYEKTKEEYVLYDLEMEDLERLKRQIRDEDMLHFINYVIQYNTFEAPRRVTN